MSAPLFNDDAATALQNSLSLGLATAPLKSTVYPALTQLALLAAWQRCERPQTPDFAVPPEASRHKQRYLSVTTRSQLVRLANMTKKEAGNRLVAMALDAIRLAGLALHPFDYARLEDALARNAERIDAGARDWLQTIRPEKELAESLYDGPALDESTVAQAGKRQKIAFVSDRRSADPSAGRALIERLFPDEPAAIRLELLGILSNRLTSDDRPFLESLTTDRAQTVREKAEQLLGILPGTEAFSKRIVRLKEDLTIKTEGLLRRRKVFVYKAPANVRPHEVALAQATLLHGLSLDTIAEAYGETPESLIAIAASSLSTMALTNRLIVMAAGEGNLRLIESHPEFMDGDDGTKAVALLQSALPHLLGPDRERLIEFALPVKRWTVIPQIYMLDMIADAIGRPLPTSLAQSVISTSIWDKVDSNRLEATVEAVAPLIPAEHSKHFVERFENISPRAAQYHKFLSTLSEPVT